MSGSAAVMIDASDLHFTYPGSEVEAVAGISFAVERGEIFGFLGPNGAGKSTTQRVLIRLLHGYTGTASLAGRDLRDWGDDLYEKIGVHFEHPNHYLKLTGRENLAYFGALYQRRGADPSEILERVGLADAADERVATYSKGMRVRLGLARSLIHMPEVLFLDEPTGGLDPVTNREVRALLREYRDRGTTIFLTTHDMVVADALCDRVAFIVGGRVPVTGVPDELKRHYGSPTVRVETGPERRGTDFPLAGIGENEDFLALLRGGDVVTLHTLETTLEEVFVQVTGRTLR